MTPCVIIHWRDVDGQECQQQIWVSDLGSGVGTLVASLVAASDAVCQGYWKCSWVSVGSPGSAGPYRTVRDAGELNFTDGVVGVRLNVIGPKAALFTATDGILPGNALAAPIISAALAIQTSSAGTPVTRFRSGKRSRTNRPFFVP